MYKTRRMQFFIILAFAVGTSLGLILSHIHSSAIVSETYPANAADVLERHSLLLNQAADILWNTPEAFYAVREEDESFSRFTIDDLLSYSKIYSCFSVDEIHLLQDVISTTKLCSIGMYYSMYGRARAVSLTFECTDKYQKRLIYICATDDNSGHNSEQQVKKLLDYMNQGAWVAYQSTNYLNWYVEIRSAEDSFSYQYNCSKQSDAELTKCLQSFL